MAAPRLAGSRALSCFVGTDRCAERLAPRLLGWGPAISITTGHARSRAVYRWDAQPAVRRGPEQRIHSGAINRLLDDPLAKSLSPVAWMMGPSA